MSSHDLTEKILQFIQAKGYSPRQIEDLALAMNLGAEEQGSFHDACKALMKSGRIVLGAGNALLLAEPPGRIVGIFRGNPRGFGFVVPEFPNAHGDLYIPAGATGGAITGDTVSAKVLKRGKRNGKMLYEGRIVAVLNRGQSRFVGELQEQLGRWLVIPDGNTLHAPIRVGDVDAKNARAGDQVVVEVIRYPQERQEAKGVIVKVLGRRGEPSVDVQGIIEQYGFAQEFSAEVLAEAHRAAGTFDPESAAADRLDLTDRTVITIDPVDARDFDDAISLDCHKDGTFELGVHIADVSHFVTPGSALDEEAKQRSNSVYLHRTVVPMLPEVLSNGVCSLQEREARLTKSAFITYDGEGNVLKAHFANSIIRSTKRLTYEQASAIIEGKPGRISAKVVTLMRHMDDLARRIRKRRLAQGMIVLDLPEVEPVHDGDGRVIDVQPADTSFSHTIIEMFMVEANEAVARLMVEHKVPALRRVHEDPDDIADGNLHRFLKALGHDIPKDADRFDVQRLLDEVRGKPEGFAVHFAVLRSMNQAEYSPMLIGHFALASEHYTHFTSPIRRYPDLTIHRLLDAYFRGDFKQRERRDKLPTEAELTQLGSQCSSNERRAESAERELTLLTILRLLEKRVGDILSGVVVGVANVGVFVQIEHYLVEGLLRFENIRDDWWEVDVQRGRVIGQRTGRQIGIGERIEVQIARVNLPTRQMELALPGVSQGKGKARKTRAKLVHAGRGPSKRRTAPRKRSRRK